MHSWPFSRDIAVVVPNKEEKLQKQNKKKMEEQREILEQLKKTLQQLSVEPSKNDQTTDDMKAKRNEEFTARDLEHSYEVASQEFIDFMYENPTTYHVISFFSKMLDKNGFKYLSEKSSWKDSIGENGGKFYTLRNGTNLSAFILGNELEGGEGYWCHRMSCGRLDRQIETCFLARAITRLRQTCRCSLRWHSERAVA